MKVLVMGGTRFNGLALVRQLVRHGHEVTVLNRGQSAVRLPRPVRRLHADRTNYEQLRQVLRHEEVDVVQDISGYTVDHRTADHPRPRSKAVSPEKRVSRCARGSSGACRGCPRS